MFKYSVLTNVLIRSVVDFYTPVPLRGEYLYHLSDTKNTKSILTDGLVPRIGVNAARYSNKESRVYFYEDWLSSVKIIESLALDDFDPEESIIHSDTQSFTLFRVALPKDSMVYLSGLVTSVDYVVKPECVKELGVFFRGDLEQCSCELKRIDEAGYLK